MRGQTNLGQLPASRTARAASEPLSQRQNPPLCLHSPRSGPAARDKNLEEQNAEREFHYNTCGARRRPRKHPQSAASSRQASKQREAVINLHKLGDSTAPPPGVEAWRTV